MSKITTSEVEIARKETVKRCVDNLKFGEEVGVGLFKLSGQSKVVVDGQYRDRAIWGGDLYASGPAAYKYLIGGKLYWRNSLLAIASKQYGTGKLPACVSLSLDNRLLSPFFDTYGMWWILSCDDYIERTRDKLFTKFFREIIPKLMGYFLKKVSRKLIYKTSPVNFYSNWTVLRPRENVLTNALFYQCLLIQKKYGFELPFNMNKFKKEFIRRFWDERENLFKDNINGKVTFLDGNSLCLSTCLVGDKKIGKLVKSLKRFETPFGPKAYIGSPKSITFYHRNIVSPFISYIYALSLAKTGYVKRAKGIMLTTLLSGLRISKRHGCDTVPEFWKTNGELGARVVNSPFFKHGRSMCHAWGTFGDL